MKPTTPKTVVSPSTQLRKVVSGGSLNTFAGWWQRVWLIGASLLFITQADVFGFTVAEPINLTTQTYTTTLLKSVATINRGVMQHGAKPYVFGGYVYGVYFRQGDERTMVYKLKLSNGSWSTSPLCSNTNAFGAFADPSDNHRSYDIIVDNYQYVRVTGGVHSGNASQWRSTNPTNISSFVYCPGAGEDIPDATGVTFASFRSSPSNKIFWQSDQGTPGLYSLTGFTKTWVSLGALDPSHNPQVSFDYTPYLQHNPDGGTIKQTSPDYEWDANGRMHIVIGLLNKNTTNASQSFIATDIVYAYSDDGGATVHRSDGTSIDFPISATDGAATQGEIILRENGNTTPSYNWLTPWPSITVDKGGQPVIKCASYATGNHLFRREAGQWIEYTKYNYLFDFSTDPGGVIIGQNDSSGSFTRFYNPTGNNFKTLTLPDTAYKYDRENYRDTGELVWVSLSGSATSGTLKIYRTVFN